MIDSEVKEFANVARNRHPAIARAFAESIDSGRELLRQWCYTLRNVTRQQADESLSRILSGERPYPERLSWALVPSEIAADVRQRTRYQLSDEARRAAMLNDDERFRCLKCRDLGLANTWNRRFVSEAEGQLLDLNGDDMSGVWPIWKQWRDVTGGGELALNSMKWCDCENGQRKQALRGGDVPTFDPTADFVFVCGKPKEVRLR